MNSHSEIYGQPATITSKKITKQPQLEIERESGIIILELVLISILGNVSLSVLQFTLTWTFSGEALVVIVVKVLVLYPTGKTNLLSFVLRSLSLSLSLISQLLAPWADKPQWTEEVGETAYNLRLQSQTCLPASTRGNSFGGRNNTSATGRLPVPLSTASSPLFCQLQRVTRTGLWLDCTRERETRRDDETPPTEWPLAGSNVPQ